MSLRMKLNLGSLLTLAAAWLLIATPARAAAPEQSCRETQIAFCEWAATYCSSGRAMCVWRIDTCQITDVRCLSDD
jgi:hypothetical protein